MLKFNIKEHKLEELEKYGFVVDEFAEMKCYSFNCIPYRIFINYYNGMVIVYFCVNQCYEYKDIECLERVEEIKLLIKDGLIIKE